MKRTALLFIIFILVGWVFVPATHAQAFNPAPNAEEFGTTVDDKASNGQMSKEVYTVNTQASYMNSATCMITGCSSNPSSVFYYGKSAIASIGNMVIAMYTTPPADLALWIKDTGQTLGFIPRQVNAQGIGFSGLSALLPIWEAFRNIAYALLAIIMIGIGFMVMFRKKIDPKTVVTVQNALPKIVLTLLLITFSYAIVGLMIDLMYLVIALAASLLIPVSNGSLGTQTATKYLNGGAWNLMAMVWNGGAGAADAITRLFSANGGVGLWGIITHAILAGTLGVLTGFIVALIIIIAYIRILFMLISAYIQIIISVLTGPLQILTEALPGSNGFSSWFKNLFANLAVFPITAALLMVTTILTQFDIKSPALLWTPPLLSGGGRAGIVGVIGLGLLMTIPNIARSIKEALKTKPLLGGGAGMGAAGGIAMQALTVGSMISSHQMQEKQLKASTALGESIQAGQKGPQITPPAPPAPFE
jgi:hypothetical protein